MAFNNPSTPQVVHSAMINVDGNLPKPTRKVTVKSPKVIGDSYYKELSNSGGVKPISAPKLSSKTEVMDEMSMPVPEKGFLVPKQKTPDTPAQAIAKEGQAARNMQAGLAGASFIADVINANSAYQSISGQAQLNILQARNQASDSIFRGRQAQLDAQSEGYQAGQDALLAMAAQGQDVTGAAVGKIQGSYEAMGIMNGMREEINSMREAMGFELEEINYDYQVAQAKVARDNAIIGSGLNFATTMAFAGA